MRKISKQMYKELCDYIKNGSYLETCDVQKGWTQIGYHMPISSYISEKIDDAVCDFCRDYEIECERVQEWYDTEEIFMDTF